MIVVPLVPRMGIVTKKLETIGKVAIGKIRFPFPSSSITLV